MIKYSATIASGGTESMPYLFKGNIIESIETCAKTVLTQLNYTLERRRI